MGRGEVSWVDIGLLLRHERIVERVLVLEAVLHGIVLEHVLVVRVGRIQRLLLPLGVLHGGLIELVVRIEGGVCGRRLSCLGMGRF